MKILALTLLALPQAEIVDLGQIDFPNSGAQEAQTAFLRGVLLLHSFEYEDARESFQEASEIDPDFALAYWGEALTHSYPLWQKEDVEAAREALGRLAPTPEERRAKAPTDRERKFLAGAELLFGEGDRIHRQEAYSRHLGEMWENDRTDIEAGAFYALSILGTNHGVRQIPTYMRAAAVGEEVYLLDPEHPGALHYLIHSYDDPVHAPLGLRMARAYDKVAPAAAHALHMPSHIYVALGMWEESARANVSSYKAADARRARKDLPVDERGYHSIEWLAYSWLQLGRHREAEALLVQMELDAQESGSERARSNLVAMRATHLTETEDWSGHAAEMEIDLTGISRPNIAADLLVRGMAAVGNEDLKRAKEILADMRGEAVWEGADGKTSSASCCAPAEAVDGLVDQPGRVAAEVMALELEGLIRLREGETEAGLKLLRRAAELEDSMEYDFGPPMVVKPAHELLGLELLALHPAEARVEFEAALRRAPRRYLSLLGLAAACSGPEDRQPILEELRSIRSSADDPSLSFSIVWPQHVDSSSSTESR